MGVSTDAILVFGMPFEEGSEAEDIINQILEVDEAAGMSLEKFQKKMGAEILEHCSHGSPMYIIGTKFERAWRGHPVAITPVKLKSGPRDLAAIRAFCEALKLPFNEKKCKWWLCSYWDGDD